MRTNVVVCALLLAAVLPLQGAKVGVGDEQGVDVEANSFLVPTSGRANQGQDVEQRGEFHEVMFEEDEDRSEKDHWKDVSILMEGVAAVARARRPVGSEMRFAQTKTLVSKGSRGMIRVKSIAYAVIEAMKEAFKWVMEALKAAMKKAIAVMKASFAKLRELSRKAMEASRHLAQRAKDVARKGGELVKSSYEATKAALQNSKELLKGQFDKAKEVAKKTLAAMKDKFKNRLKECTADMTKKLTSLPSTGDLKETMKEK